MKKWGIGAAALGVLATGGYFALSAFVQTEAEARVAQAANRIRRHVKQFDYTGVTVAPLSQSIEIRDVSLDDGRGRFFSIGAVRFERFDWAARDLPRYGSVRLAGLRLTLDPAAASGLKSYGYERIEAQAQFGYAFDDEAHALEISLHVEAADAGVLTFKTKLGGLGPEFLTAASQAVNNPLAIGFAALAVTLTEASAEFEDRSLVDRTVGAAAQRRGVEPEQIRAELIKAVAAPDAPAAQTTESLRAFLEKPGKIKLSVAPEKPVSYAEAVDTLMFGKMTPQEFLSKRLNFRVSHE